MRINRKNTGRASSIPEGLAFGSGINLIVTILASVVLAKLVDMEKMAWENIGYGILVLILAASFLGSIASYKRIKRQRFASCMLSGVIYFGILLSITALFFGGQYESVGVTALLILAGSGSAGLLGLRENRGGKRNRNVARYR